MDLKAFTTNLIVVIATRGVRRFLNKQVENVTPSQLREAIENNDPLWPNIPDDIKISGKNLKGKWNNLLQEAYDQITTDLIMKWLQEDHLDLCSTIINTPNGMTWLDTQVNGIKKKIISDL